MDPAITRDVGHETLERIADSLSQYNDWMYEQIAPHVGNHVLEIGSGIGNLSDYLMGSERLCLSDISETYLSILRERFHGIPSVSIVRWDLDAAPPESLAAGSFDTIICLNVLEHIQDDLAALSRMRSLLRPGGNLILLVPAHPILFNGFDRGLDHYRRYQKTGLRDALVQTGFQPERLWYFNVLGAIGWFINGNVLRKQILPSGQMKLFDRLVPLLKLERLAGPPFGISLITVAKVPAPPPLRNLSHG